MTVNTSGTPLSWDDYYPFGSIMSGRSANNSGIDGRYKFTGKERDIAINGAETGYDYFGARYYDSWLGRWMQVDPLAEKYPGWSPYNYTMNNPINNFDSDGRKTWSINLVKGLGGKVLGGGASISWVWDDKGNAGLLTTFNFGAVGGGSLGIAFGETKTNAKTIYDLSGFGYQLGAQGGDLFGFSTSKSGDFSGTYSSEWEYNVGLISGASAYATLSYSSFIFSGNTSDFKEITKHILEGGKYKIDWHNYKVYLLDDHGDVIKEIKLKGQKGKVFKSYDNKNGDGTYFSVPDKTQVNSTSFIHLNYDVSSQDGRN